MRATSVLLSLALLLPSVLAQGDSSCPQSTRDQIQQCLDQVEADEAALPVPCASSDWACICNKQQGLISCYTPCPEQQDFDAIRYNNDNCNGQHGVTNAAAAGNGGGTTYSGSALTTTVPPNGGSGGSTPTASASTSDSTSAATSSTTSTGPPSSSSSSATSQPASSTASNSTRTPTSSSSTRSSVPSSNGTTNAAAPASLPLAALSITSALLLGGGMAFFSALL